MSSNNMSMLAWKLENKAVEKMLLFSPVMAAKITPRLRSINVGLTGSCNLRCKMCFAGHSEGGYMSEEMFLRLMLDVSGRDVAVGLTFAGEAMLHPKFDLFCEIAYRSSGNVGLSTNGTLLDKHLIAVSEYVQNLSVSLDGLGEVNDEIRIGSSAEQIEQNIRLLMTGSKHPVVGVCMTVTSQSKRQVDEFVRYWVTRVDYVRVKSAFNSRGEMYKTCLPEQSKRSNFCPFLNNFLGVLWNGDVTTCCVDLQGRYAFSNIRGKSIWDVWDSNYLKRLRYEFASGKLNHKRLCANCNVWPTYNNIIEYRRCI